MLEQAVALPRLTSLRAAAAMWVFLFHLGFLSFAVGTFEYGYAGVAFFFVLSGFVLTWVSRPGDQTGSFYRRRFARIYPTYLAAIVLALIVTPAGVAATAATLGLVQSWWAVTPHGASTITFPVNSPAWSLSCEAAFYAVFPAMMSLRHRVQWRYYSALMVLWSLVCAAAAVLVIHHTGGTTHGFQLTYYLPVFRIGEFALGSGLCVAIQSGWRPRIPFIPTLILLLLVIAGVQHHPIKAPLGEVVMLPFFALVILAAALADIDGRSGVLRLRPFVYAGEVSFAFYIVQFPLLAEVYRWRHSGWQAIVLAFLIVPAASVVAHHLIERPGQRLLSGRRRPA
jgi:peptidoglycan/LPS O-acetylase OafA/YrhL